MKKLDDNLYETNVAATVGELVALLSELPQDFNIRDSFSNEPVYLTIDTEEKVVWV